ncbi:hypothetical protein FRB90_011297 [Tulasnella sp. 427]|nr:hypothetical protein FRB90_011297 [Tulasnella sp. 427]
MSFNLDPPSPERKRSVRFSFDRNSGNSEQDQVSADFETQQVSSERPSPPRISLQTSAQEVSHTRPGYQSSTDFTNEMIGQPRMMNTVQCSQPEYVDSTAQYAYYSPHFDHLSTFHHGEVSPKTDLPAPRRISDTALDLPSLGADVPIQRKCLPDEGQRGSVGSWSSYTLTESPSPVPAIPERIYGFNSRSSDGTYDTKLRNEADPMHVVQSPVVPQPFSPPVPAFTYKGSPASSRPQITHAFRQDSSPSILRSALRNSQNQVATGRGEELDRVNTTALEEGDSTRVRSGVFTNLLKLYGMSGGGLHHRRTGRSHSQISMANSTSRGRDESCDSLFFPTARNYGGYQTPSRCTSTQSFGNMELLDPDDPRITGAMVNTIDQEKHAKDTVGPEAKLDKKKKRQASIKYHISSVLARQTFILRLAKALMLFGSPSHRLESQLKATAVVLDVQAEFVHMPNIVIASFGDFDTKTSQTHFIKVSGVLQLGRLHSVHNVYRSVVHDEIGVEEATAELNQLMRAKPLFGTFSKTILAALCTGLICPMAFGGSFIDMLIAAGEGALLSYLQFGLARKNAMYSNVFEISVAIIMSFIARALASIPSQIFCYSAISSAGIVLVLPGYMILCAALELASKNIVTGSVKLTFAIVYSLFLGFGLTIGSDLYLLLDSNARNAQLAASETMNQVIINGHFAAVNDSAINNFAGSFTFTNGTSFGDPPNTVEGCFRDPSWPWYLQPFPLWSLAILVPAFSIFSSASNGQPFLSKELPVMTLISCASFTANTAANRMIFNRSDIVSAIGAFVAGLLGNLYSRVTKTGTGFTSMVTGVLFLVPAGIAATGGLSQNYRGLDGDQYSNGLIIGLRTVQVAIGITIGPPIGAWFSTHPLPITAFQSLDLNIYATPALLSLVLLLVEIALLVVALPETRQLGSTHPQAKQPVHSQDSSPQETTMSVTQRISALRRLGRIHLLFLALFSGVEFTLTFLSFDLFDWNNAQNGRLLMTIGIVSALLQGGYVRRAKFAEAAMARRGVFTCAVATAILAMLPSLAGGNSSKGTATSMLYVAAVFLAFTSATVVNALNAMASMQCDDAGAAAAHPDLAKGKALGRHRSSGQLGRAIGPILACAAYWTVGPAITYGAGAIAMVALFASMRMDSLKSAGQRKTE